MLGVGRVIVRLRERSMGFCLVMVVINFSSSGENIGCGVLIVLEGFDCSGKSF